MTAQKQIWKIRVDHELGFFSFYEIKAGDYHDAEREAKQKFVDDFCGGKEESKKLLDVFTFDKYRQP